MDVPWGWEFRHHLFLVDSPNQIEVPWGVGILISSYPCGHGRSMGVGILISSFPCGQSKSN